MKLITISQTTMIVDLKNFEIGDKKKKSRNNWAVLLVKANGKCFNWLIVFIWPVVLSVLLRDETKKMRPKRIFYISLKLKYGTCSTLRGENLCAATVTRDHHPSPSISYRALMVTRNVNVSDSTTTTTKVFFLPEYKNFTSTELNTFRESWSSLQQNKVRQSVFVLFQKPHFFRAFRLFGQWAKWP